MIVFRILVVIGAILLFTITLLLNQKTKIKGDEKIFKDELPENCLNCSNKTCLASLEKYKSDQEVQKIINECSEGEDKNEK